MAKKIPVHEIKAPRYCDRKVLVMKSKVKPGYNYITFTEDNGFREYPPLGMTGKIYRFLGEQVFNTCRIYTNLDTFQICWEIPLCYLEEVSDPNLP